MIRGRTALGWVQLVHHPGRFVMALAGVTAAVIMVFMQLGFMNMVFDTTVMVHRLLKADLVLVSPVVRDVAAAGTIPRRRLMQALGVEGVADGEALYVTTRDWTRPDGERGTLMLMGVRPDFDAFRDPDITRQQRGLAQPGTILLDSGARGDYRAVLEGLRQGQPWTTEMGGRRVTVIGDFRLGASFGNEGLLITADDTFQALALNRDAGAPSIGMLRLVPGADPAVVKARLSAVLDPADSRVMTLDEFVQHTRGFMIRNSPIAIVFGFGTAVGLLVGAMVVAQILSADVQEHMAEYATFKAMGFSNGRILSIVYEQSAILAVFGFPPGLGLALIVYAAIRWAVSMPISMPVDRVAIVFVATVAMCAVAGTLATRRARKADPAEVF
jgi:putative ABC transport system permease protein